MGAEYRSAVANAKREPVRMLVLLRGINVGGHNKVPMAELRSALSAHGFDDVATYIQSGNIAITTDAPAEACAAQVAGILSDNFDVNVPVIALDQATAVAIADAASFAEDGNMSYQLIYFAGGTVDVTGMDGLDRDRFTGDEISATPEAVYVSYGDGQAKSKLTVDHLERAAGVNLTGRNVKTVAKLLTL